MHKLEHDVKELPVLPLKNVVLFPQLLLPLTVGRPSSLAAVQAAVNSDPQEIILVTQRDPSIESPSQDDLYTVGTRATIRRHARNEEQLEVFVLGVERVVIIKVEHGGDYPKARFRELPLPEDTGPEVEALQGAVQDLTSKAISPNRSS